MLTASTLPSPSTNPARNQLRGWALDKSFLLVACTARIFTHLDQILLDQKITGLWRVPDRYTRCSSI